MAADFSVLGDTRLDHSGFESGIKKITSTGLKILGTGLATATAGIAAFGAYSIKSGMEFDTAMSQVAATMGTTVDKINDLTEFAKKMGSTTKFTAIQSAEGLNILAQAGLNAEEQIATLPTVLNLASAGSISLEQSASYVTATVKGFSDKMGNAAYYANLMALGANLTSTDVNALGTALSDASATAASYGQTAEGTTLSLMRLSEQNVTGAEASTALSRAMMDLFTPTSSAKKQLESLGITAYDSSGKARDFGDVVDELNGALSGMSDEEANATKNAIFTTYGLQAFNKMTVSSTDKVNAFRTGLMEASDGMGAAAEMAATQIDNLNGDADIFKSAVEGMALAVYDGLQPALREFVQFGTGAVGQLQQGFEENGVDGLMDALGTVLGELVTKIAEFSPTLISLAVGLLQALADGIASNWPIIQQALRDCLDAVLDGITELIPALTPVSDAIKWIADNFDKLIPIILTATAAILGFKAGAVLTTLIKGFQEARLAVTLFSMGQTQAQIASAALDGTLKAHEVLVGLLTGKISLATLAQKAFNAVMAANPIGIVIAIIAALVAAFLYLWNTCEPFKQFWLDLWQGIQDAFAAVVDFLGGCVDAIVAFFTETIPSAITAAGEWFSGLLQNLSNFFTVQIPAFIQSAIGWFLQLPTNIAFAIGQIIGYIILFGVNLISFVTTTIPAWFNSMVAWFAQLPGAIWNWLCTAIANITAFGAQLISNAVTAGSAFISNIISFFAQLPGNIASWLTNTISNVSQFVANLASKAVQAASGFCTSLQNGLAALPGQMLTIGSNIVSGIWNGIKAGWTWLTDSVKNLANSLLDGVKSVLGIHSPSKKFAWIGKMSAVGMEVGFEDEDPMGTIRESLSTQMGKLRTKFSINAQNSPSGNTTQNIDNSERYIFYEPVKTPSETARTIHRQRTSGLAGARA